MTPRSYTDQQQAEFRAEFSDRRRRQWLVVAAVLAAVAVVALAGRRPEGAVFGIAAATIRPLGIVLVLGAVVFSLINWRCPACGRYLGRAINPSYCARCGIALRE